MKRKMKKTAKIHKHIARTQKSSSVETFIESRFNRLEDKLDSFKDEINSWKQEFVKQLTKLNAKIQKL